MGKMPREMTGAELQSMLKSNINLKSLGGMRCEELNLQPEDLLWWRDAKIGMFIHWGLYSVLGRGEWARHNEQIPWDEYMALANLFNPRDFSMDELCSLAKDFGARYMVFVTKHHDGFSLWNSPGAYGNFTSYATAAHRDFVREYTDACRRAGLRVGLYYSPMDWRFPGYFDPEGQRDNA
jgi:alpha-L-fucosidase